MKIIIVGYGKMGHVLEQAARESGVEVAAIVGREPGTDVYAELSVISAPFDCIIDFSHVGNIEKVLRYAQEHTKPVVICTTGFSEGQQNLIRDTAAKTPVVYSGNMSIGVNVLMDVVNRISAALGDSFDIELIEKHHNLKEDAPSGTAKMLLSAVHDIDKKTIVNGREGMRRRTKNEIGVHAVRGGTIVGEHSVIFAGNDEIIEIKHTALSKRIFAEGALRAAAFVTGLQPALYRMSDVLATK